MIEYIGNPLQLRGAEKYILQDGKGDGMHFLNIRNGLGLEVWLSLDRAGDVSRVNFKGDNFGYFASCGYVAPQYYDDKGAGFLKSFTAGFFTTCGLTSVGSPCVDEGEELPLHGTISHIPAVLNGIDENENELIVKLTVTDSTIFGKKLVMSRIYNFSYLKNEFTVTDTVKNNGDTVSPYMIMYHCNMGYPLLSENAVINIPNNGITPRDNHAAQYIDTALLMEKPQPNYQERCYYYNVLENDDIATVGIYNSDIKKGLVMNYNKTALPYFVEWKMMGKTDYVLGLEPANCTPDGRDVLRKNGTLQFINPNEQKTTNVTFKFIEECF